MHLCQKQMTLPSTVRSELHSFCVVTHHYVVLGNINSSVVALYFNKAFPNSTEKIPEGATFGVLLDRTSFYAESGGQEHDTGSIVIDGVAEFDVSDVQVYNGYVLHIGQLKYGSLSVGDEVVSSYDEVRSFYCYVTVADMGV